MEKQRVKKGEPYWFVDIDGRAWDRYERNEVMDSVLFDTGNYFHTKEEADRMCKKFLAVLKGADVIEMPESNDVGMIQREIGLEVGGEDEELVGAASLGAIRMINWLIDKIVK